MSKEAQATPASSASPAHAHLAFGITLDQIDVFDRTLATLLAIGDVMSLGRSLPLDPRTLPTLGGVMYDAACVVRGLLDQVSEQRMEAPVAAGHVPPVPDRSPPAGTFAGY